MCVGQLSESWGEARGELCPFPDPEGSQVRRELNCREKPTVSKSHRFLKTKYADYGKCVYIGDADKKIVEPTDKSALD